MASTDSPKVMRRTKGVYFNEDKEARFNAISGRTFLVKRVDPRGMEYVERYTVPDKITAFAREATDRLLETLERSHTD